MYSFLNSGITQLRPQSCNRAIHCNARVRTATGETEFGVVGKLRRVLSQLGSLLYQRVQGALEGAHRMGTA